MYQRAGLVTLAMCGTVMATAGIASADATDDYPIPNRILKTTCTVEQIMAAARDVEPAYYERYMIDYNNHSPEIHQATQEHIHWFFSGLRRPPGLLGGIGDELRRSAAGRLGSSSASPGSVLRNLGA